MAADLSPTARALLTLELVQGSPGVTAERLADKLGVSERAARRYVTILREAGIPIESARGPYGGYRVGRGLRLPPLVFSSAEALGLVMAVLDGHHEASDPSDPVGSALGKIVRALPEPVAAQAEAVRRTTSARAGPRRRPPRTRHHRRPRGRRLGPPARAARLPLGGRVRSGSWTSTPGRSSSGTGAGTCSATPWPRTPSGPSGSTGSAASRSCRTRSGRPSTSTRWPCSRRTSPRGGSSTSSVVVDASVDAVARCLPRSLGALEPLGDGRCRLVGSTSDPRWYAEQLTAIPAPFRVVRCPELQDCVRSLGERLLAAAGAGPAG